MSRISMQGEPGWLLYAGCLGANAFAVAGDAYPELSFARSLYAQPECRLTADLYRPVMRQDTQASPASLGALMWEMLATWPQPGREDGRRWHVS